MLSSEVTTTMTLSTTAQVRNALRTVALIALFFGTAALFLGGVAYTFFPSDHSHFLGWILLAVSTAVMIFQMDRWVKVLPGLLGLAVLNGLITIFSGHVLANPTQPVGRLEAFGLTLFFVVSCVLSGTFKDRQLNFVDRTALMAFVFSFAWLLAYDGSRYAPGGKGAAVDARDLIAISVGLSFLIVAWLYYHFLNRNVHRSRRAPQPFTKA
jgi:hypothetical protein